MSNRPQRETRARQYRAIIPARPASLEPEAWPDPKSGFRRADLLIASEPRLVSDDQLRDPRIPKAPSVPRVHVPRPRPVAVEQRSPADVRAAAVEALGKQAASSEAAGAKAPLSKVGKRWPLPIAVLCVIGLVAATVALVAGLS